MQSDLPHTLYKRPNRKDGKSGGSQGGFKYNENDPAIQKQLEANKRAALRKAHKSGEYTTEQLFQ